MRNKHHLNRPFANRGARPSAGRAHADLASGKTARKLGHHWRTTASTKSAPRGMRPMSAAALDARATYGW